MENSEEYKGENFNTIEGAWDWHSRGIPETVYSPEELEYLMGEQIMFKKDFEEATAKLLSQLQPANNDYSVKMIEERIKEIEDEISELHEGFYPIHSTLSELKNLLEKIKNQDNTITPNN